jgi:hypothetical protein
VVLASGRGGPVPSLAEAVAGGPIRGSWWAHEKGGAIFRALGTVGDSPEVLCFRLVGGKLTFVHRRLWPALIRLAGEIGGHRLAAIRQEHTAAGHHRNIVTAFPHWAPPEVERAARALSAGQAATQLGPGVLPAAPGSRRAPSSRNRRSPNR